MKRGLIIAAAVLIPFSVLIALGFSSLHDPPTLAAPPPPIQPAIVLPQPERPLAPPPPVLVAAPPLHPPLPEVQPFRAVPLDPDTPPAVVAELKRKPIIAAVDPLVRQCFKDAADVIHEPQTITVTFSTNDAGRFEDVVIRSSSWQDPQLEACVIDSFEDATFEAPAHILRRQSHTFTFSPVDPRH